MMQLGVNFLRDAHQPIGFNADAVRALRPALVRMIVTKVDDLLPWFDAARAARLEVLWCLPIEALGRRASAIASRLICDHGRDVTHGIEFGWMPWVWQIPPAQFLADALVAAALPAWTVHDQLAGAVTGHARARIFDGPARPLILALAFDGSRASTRWFVDALTVAARVPAIHDTFHAVSVHATRPGTPWPTYRLRGAQFRIMRAVGLPIAVTEVGWQVGAPFASTWRRLIERVREAWPLRHEADARRAFRATPAAVTPWVRRRWLLEAYRQAARLGATHFLLEPDTAAVGVNGWPLYDPQAQRPDPVWTTLAWQHARTLTPRLEDA